MPTRCAGWSADQISALNALADVVKRQAAGFDISGPGLYMPSGGGPARENLRAPRPPLRSTGRSAPRRNKGRSEARAESSIARPCRQRACTHAPRRASEDEPKAQSRGRVATSLHPRRRAVQQTSESTMAHQVAKETPPQARRSARHRKLIAPVSPRRHHHPSAATSERGLGQACPGRRQVQDPSFAGRPDARCRCAAAQAPRSCARPRRRDRPQLPRDLERRFTSGESHSIRTAWRTG